MMDGKLDLKKAFLALVIYFFAATAVMHVLGMANLLPVNDLIARNFIAEVVLAVGSITALLALKKNNVLNFKKTGFGEGLKAGTYMLVVAGLVGFSAICALLIGTLKIGVGLPHILLFVVYCFLIGVAEEVMFRGIIQNSFHAFFGEKSYKAIASAIVCSGVCFGLYHLTNAFAGISLVAVILQAFMVIPIGIILCAAYYRSGRNLWVCVFLHALYDGMLFVRSDLLSGNASAESIIGKVNLSFNLMTLLGVVAMWSIVMGIALFTIRKKKIHVPVVAGADAVAVDSAEATEEDDKFELVEVENTLTDGKVAMKATKAGNVAKTRTVVAAA